VHLLNELMDALCVSESAVERLVARVMALPASRFLRLKRGISLLVADRGSGAPAIVRGTYQSPILIQWSAPPGRTRLLQLTLTEFV